jgi:hypothetical protein
MQVPLATMMEEGQEGWGGLIEERRLASGVIWKVAPESAIQSGLTGRSPAAGGAAGEGLAVERNEEAGVEGDAAPLGTAAMARARRAVVSDNRGADLPSPHMVDHGWRKDAQAAGSHPTGTGKALGGGGHRGAERLHPPPPRWRRWLPRPPQPPLGSEGGGARRDEVLSAAAAARSAARVVTAAAASARGKPSPAASAQGMPSPAATAAGMAATAASPEPEEVTPTCMRTWPSAAAARAAVRAVARAECGGGRAAPAPRGGAPAAALRAGALAPRGTAPREAAPRGAARRGGAPAPAGGGGGAAMAAAAAARRPAAAAAWRLGWEGREGEEKP